MSEIFGYFNSPEQTEPAFDPGLAAPCPFCLNVLVAPFKTISLMGIIDNYSYFYRAHRACYEYASAAAVQEIEGSLINSLASDQQKPGGDQ